VKLIASLRIPIKTVSEANSSEHWTKKHKRHKAQKLAVGLYFRGDVSKAVLQAGLPLHIVITRIAPRELDEGDNLPMSVKPIRDYLAALIKPGLQIGRADGTSDFAFDVTQEKGKPKEYAVRIEFYNMQHSVSKHV